MFCGKEPLTPPRHTAGFNYLPKVTTQESVDLENTTFFFLNRKTIHMEKKLGTNQFLHLAMYTATEFKRCYLAEYSEHRIFR